MFTLFFFNSVTDFLLFFYHLLLKSCNVFICETHSNKDILHCKLHYNLVWNILIVSFMYLELNWNMSAVSIFSYHWYSMFYAKNYHSVYYNEQQMYLATLWSALIFKFDIKFIVRMRSNKNHKVRHSRKKFVG